MSDHDKTLDYLESQIPTLAVAALTVAYWQALAAGLSVLVCEDGAIYENFPDGSRRFVMKTEPRVHVPAGTRLELR
jgi:hypothetical protein